MSSMLTFKDKNIANKNSEYDQEVPHHKPQTTPWHREEERSIFT